MSSHDQNYSISKTCATIVLSSKFMLNTNILPIGIKYFTNWYKIFYQLIKHILPSGKKHEYSTSASKFMVRKISDFPYIR